MQSYPSSCVIPVISGLSGKRKREPRVTHIRMHVLSAVLTKTHFLFLKVYIVVIAGVDWGSRGGWHELQLFHLLPAENTLSSCGEWCDTEHQRAEASFYSHNLYPRFKRIFLFLTQLKLQILHRNQMKQKCTGSTITKKRGCIALGAAVLCISATNTAGSLPQRQQRIMWMKGLRSFQQRYRQTQAQYASLMPLEWPVRGFLYVIT